MKRVFYVTLLVAFLLSYELPSEQKINAKTGGLSSSPHAITYGLSAGRFGDNLLSYMHGKWLAFRYNLPFYYQPFAYSEFLVLDSKEKVFNHEISQAYPKHVIIGRGHEVNLELPTPTLFVIPYFADYKWEWDNYGYAWNYAQDYCVVDWDNPEFIKELKEMIAPKQNIKKLDLPKGRIPVAIHVRTGGGWDDHEAARLPLKYPPEQFFVEHLYKVYQFFNYAPLYVYIFTDHQNPKEIMDSLKKHFQKEKIVFDTRISGNHHNSNVIEDFFAFTQFDALIRPQSNFSLCAGKLANYKIEICPEEYYSQNGTTIIKSTTTIKAP